MSKIKDTLDLQFAIICDYAIMDVNGKMSILGIFDNIFVTQIPSTHPSFFIVASLTSDENIENKELTVMIKRNEDNFEVFKQPIPIKLELAKGENHAVFNAVLQISQLRIEKLGEYSLILSLGEKVLSNKLINIKLLEQSTASSK